MRCGETLAPGRGSLSLLLQRKRPKKAAFCEARGHTHVGHFFPRRWHPVASALRGPIGPGTRTVCHPEYLSVLVQHQRVSAQRCALPIGMQGKPTLGKRGEMETLARMCAHSRFTGRPRSRPELAGAAPVRLTARCHSGSASKARLVLWGHSLLPGHSANRLCRGRYEVLRMGKAAFFGYFLCSSKESDPRPGEGQCK